MTKKTPKTVLFTEISYEDFEEFLKLHLDNVKELMENLDPRTLMPDDRHLYIDTIYAHQISYWVIKIIFNKILYEFNFRDRKNFP